VQFPYSPSQVSGCSSRPPRRSRWVRRSEAFSAQARTSVVRNRSGWSTDVRATIAVPMLNVLDTGFGRRNSRRKIAP
jgi:hypothetical protein